MTEYPPDTCPSCGSEDTLYGPKPYTCAVCTYVVTPGSVEEPPEDEPEADRGDEGAGKEEESTNG